MTTKQRTERSSARRPPVRTTLNLPAETSDALREIAADRNMTLTEVIRRALRVEQFVHETQKSGGKILVEDADNTVKELLIF